MNWELPGDTGTLEGKLAVPPAAALLRGDAACTGNGGSGGRRADSPRLDAGPAEAAPPGYSQPASAG
jgi:hypothetical protein